MAQNESTTSETRKLNSNNGKSYLNSAVLALNQIQNGDPKKVDDSLKEKCLNGEDQLMNPGTTTPMSNTDIMNLLISRKKQVQEEQLKVTGVDSTAFEETEDLTERSQEDEKSDTEVNSFQPGEGNEIEVGVQEYYATLETNDECQSSYEVATYMTEHSENGQIIGDSGGTVSVGENNVTTITLPDGQVISLGEEALGQIADLSNFGGSVQLATSQNSDGTTQLQFLNLKQEIKDNQFGGQTSAERRTFQCDIDNCSKQFSTQYRLKAHGRTHSGETFTCCACHKQFVSHSDLQKHSKTHLGRKDFICEVDGCKKEYTTAHHLKVHKRQHSGERPFICEWDGCDKTFTTGYGLKSHFRTHTNERPYKCNHSQCTKAFKTSGDLQKHARTHTGERPFTCPFTGCNRSFTTSNIRKVHLRTHTGEKPYKCEIGTCGREFASATNYKNHSRIHTGERPYVCEVPGCLKRFTEYSSLYKHNIVHTQQKPYTCALCNKTYRQTSTLAMHKRTVHGTGDLTDSEKKENVRASAKRLKITPPNRVASSSSSSSSSAPTGYLQGMSLVINNAASTDQQFSAEISTQQLSESGEVPGAIAIPIQVTMNADGTIAGAQGLNLTDGSGRMIPVNLSVSIPMSSFPSMDDNNGDVTTTQQGGGDMNSMYSQTEKLDNNMDIITDSSSRITPRRSSSGAPSDDDNQSDQLTPRILPGASEQGLGSNSLNVGLMTAVSSSPSMLMNGVLNGSRGIMRSAMGDDNYVIDADEGDVTDRYLTSHYRKDLKANEF